MATSERGERREGFRRFIEDRPPLFCTHWMYGGAVLLFYRTAELEPDDGETVVDGLECKVWRSGAPGTHSRDLFLLADTLGAA